MGGDDAVAESGAAVNTGEAVTAATGATVGAGGDDVTAATGEAVVGTAGCVAAGGAAVIWAMATASRKPHTSKARI